MSIKKRDKQNKRYIPLDDIKEIDDAFLGEMEIVKKRLNNVVDEAIINTFQEVLLSAYSAAIDLKTIEREVEYDIKFAEIAERRRALKPWRRCWLWRLLFQPLTNRAQDIIEDRAELDADRVHTEAEKAIDNDRKLLSDSGKKISKRERKRIMRDKLQAVIDNADKSETNEVFNEEQEPPQAERVSREPGEPREPAKGQLPGQMTLYDVQEQPQITTVRRARPPRSCRKPRTLGQ